MSEIDIFESEKEAIRKLLTLRGFIYTLMIVYGLVAFLNYERYPLFGLILRNTNYEYLSVYDGLFGLILFTTGMLYSNAEENGGASK